MPLQYADSSRILDPKAMPRVGRYMTTCTSLVSDNLTSMTHICDYVCMLAPSSCGEKVVKTTGYVVNIHQVIEIQDGTLLIGSI